LPRLSWKTRRCRTVLTMARDPLGIKDAPDDKHGEGDHESHCEWLVPIPTGKWSMEVIPILGQTKNEVGRPRRAPARRWHALEAEAAAPTWWPIARGPCASGMRSIATRVRAGEVKVPTRELNVREVRKVGPAGSTEQVGRSGARLLAWGRFHGVRPTDQANVRSATQVPLLRRSLLRLGSARAQRLVAHWLGNGDEVSTRAARKGRRYVEDDAREEGNLVAAACSARSHKGHRGIFSGTPVSRRGCVGMPRTRWHPLEKGCGSVEFSPRCDCSEHHHFGVKVGLLTRNINR
jgi:hypothetical protein